MAPAPRSRRIVGAELALLVVLVVIFAGLWLGPVKASVAQAAAPIVPSVPAATPSLAAAAPLAVTAMQTDDGGRTQPVATSRNVGAADGVARVSVAIDPAVTAQTWTGVGGALTDASATLLASVPEAVDALFGAPETGGAGLDLVRLPLSATDFSVEDWTWSLGPDGTVTPPATALAALDVLDTIVDVRPDLAVLAASWTSPLEWRTMPEARGGALLDEALDDYAALLVGQAAWLLDRGIPLAAMSLGNEPGHRGNYPTLTMTDEQMVALAGQVGPTLDDLGVDLLALDHNWDDADRAVALLAGAEFDAVGFHCYGGSADDVAEIAAPHLVTECTATEGGWHTSVGWMARELIGDAVRVGSSGVVMWNLVLDPQDGPKIPGGCENCRGLLTVDPAAGEVTPTPEFHVLRQLSAAADPGAVVLPTDRVDGLPLAAFANPDGTIGVFGHNDTPSPIEVELDIAGVGVVTVSVDAWAVFSVRTVAG